MLEERRWFLKTLGTTVGASAAATLITSAGLTSAFAYTPRNESALLDGKLLNKGHMKLLHDICETVLPRTDTPSAAEVDCHGFIDHQLGQCHTKQQQESVKTLLNTIEGRAQSLYTSSYTELTAKQKTDLLIAVEAKQGFSDSQLTDFKFLKGLIIFGYFTSEVGATQALTYQAVPGGYKGSIPMTPNTKAYGSLNFY